MGLYINPGNRGFAEINDADYVDKTMLIEMTNQSIGTRDKLICVSRPRRFGKSYAAKMLAAYYDCSCDSHALFCDKKIAKTDDFEQHINKYNVISLDITGFISVARQNGLSLREVPAMIKKAIRKDLVEEGFEPFENDSVSDFLIRCARNSRRFIFVIDEWDAMIREAKDDEIAQERYLDLLREWCYAGNRNR